jgi:hypothetical protein
MGVPEYSAEWESPMDYTGLLPVALGYCLKMLGLEVPVVVVLCPALTYTVSKASESGVGPSSGISKTQVDGWAYPSERLPLVFLELLLAPFR